MSKDADTPKNAPAGDFKSRLAAAGKRLRAKDRGNTGGMAPMGAAFRLASELVVAVAVGTGIGWALDTWLGTMPLFLLLLFVVGAAAGVKNVFRTAQAMQGNTGAGTGQKDKQNDTDGA